MATPPPITREAAQTVIDARYRNRGSRRAVAAELGMSEAAVGRHLIKAKEWGLKPSVEVASIGYTAPTLPSPERPVSETIELIKGERRRQREHRDAAEWMRFTVDGGEPFCLVFVGDPHLSTCDLDLLERHLTIIRDTDRMWAVCLGDLGNQWARKLRDQYAMQSTSEREEYGLIQWMLEWPIWWAIILGNHSGGRWHGGSNALMWMRTACPVPPREWQAKFAVECAGHTWRVWAAHDFPGSSQFAEDFGPNKRALWTGAIADLFLAGDHHVFTLRQAAHPQTGKVYWAGRARGYKPLDLYAEEKGYCETDVGHSVAAVFDPRTRNLQCFADVEEAASYLTFLRLRRIAA